MAANASHEGFEVEYKSGQYKIPWMEFKLPKTSDVLKFAWEKSKLPLPDRKELDEKLPVIKPDFTKLDSVYAKKGIWVTWLGHACVLVQMDGIRILTDPVFSDRCGPTLGFQMGPTRYRKAPCSVDKLPTIDAVVISHNHYDHLDLQTVRDINTHHSNVKWFVPMGLKDWMTSSECKNVEEMDWWQKRTCTLKERPSVDITFVPAQHWSRRGAFDYNKSLWGGWCIKSGPHSFYFSGDTGYDEGLFKEIGKLGPFNLAAIPIGAYKPREFMRKQHINPEEALKIHEAINAKKSIGIHWGTFHLSSEHYLAPKEEIEKLQKKAPSDAENQNAEYDFFTVNPGESKIIDPESKIIDPSTIEDAEHG